jgi:alpha-L-fucosidase 2
MSETPILWYTRPAAEWLEALPIGNGRLGAMVFGGVAFERLQLNEDTLWSGAPRSWDNARARAVLPAVRRLIAKGNYVEAHELARQMQGPYCESYQPLGNLVLRSDAGPVEGYRRELNLRTAIAGTRYRLGDSTLTREAFASTPDQVIVVRLSCDAPGQISLIATLDSPHPHTVAPRATSSLLLQGKGPAHVAPEFYDVDPPVIYEQDGGGLTFAVCLQAVLEGGHATADAGGLHIEGANAVTLVLAARTSYAGYDGSLQHVALDPIESAVASAASAASRSFAALRAAHVSDHARLFDRVALDLGRADRVDSSGQPTDERIHAWQQSGDPALVALLFQYGRYLLIASSRPGSQPANLQGIWNDTVRPPWSSNWTLNINTQMNYWLAEPANLAECHLPLLDLVADLSRPGRDTAATNYGCRGWVAHHNTDLWRQTAPSGDFGSGDPLWALWPMAGAWLCSHLWDHYEFGCDEHFLRQRAYPVMRGAAEFCLDWLQEDGSGFLVTTPSTSPENVFTTPDGQTAAVSAASTMDMAIIWDLFTNCMEAASILDVDRDLQRELAAARARLTPPRIGRLGQLQEWAADWDDPTDRHRHTSHLFGLHPGRQITPRGTPALARAARTSLELRGDEATGWAIAWRISLWARLHDGDRAYSLLARLIARTATGGTSYAGAGAGLYPNMFVAHPPFQIDASFGVTAGITEMLLQSHDGEIHILPALPRAWCAGSVKGLRARGGFEVAIAWQDGTLQCAIIDSSRNGICRVRAPQLLSVSRGRQPVPVTYLEDCVVQFAVETGAAYRVLPRPANGVGTMRSMRFLGPAAEPAAADAGAAGSRTGTARRGSGGRAGNAALAAAGGAGPAGVRGDRGPGADLPGRSAGGSGRRRLRVRPRCDSRGGGERPREGTTCILAPADG